MYIRGEKKCERERPNGKGGLFSWSLRLSDIPAEHKYHSLTVICHFNTDVWSLNTKPLVHIPGYKTQGQFKYGPAGPGMTGYPSLPPSLSPSLHPLATPSSRAQVPHHHTANEHISSDQHLWLLYDFWQVNSWREKKKLEREKIPFKIILHSNSLLNKMNGRS